MNNFKQTGSTIRCVVATVALGMGIDIRDLDIVVHIGCPKSVISYWQEAGRCARDGRNGLSLVMYDNFSLSVKTTDAEMANIIRNSPELCIRKQILQCLHVGKDLSYDIPSSCKGCDSPKCACPSCTCCSTCTTRCQCSNKCKDTISEILK